MATSIRRGILAAGLETEGYLICLGDMPMVSTVTLIQLCERFAAQEAPAIMVATCGGKRGHPILFHKTFRHDLMQLTGDVGARSVIQAHEDAVVEVEVADSGIFLDIDTPEAYDRIYPDTAAD